MREYKQPAMKQLREQLRFVPEERLLEQLNNGEKLLTEINRNKKYPYQYVCFRITGFRPDSHPSLVMGGDELEHDLTQFIHDLALAVPAIPVEQLSEPVLTIDQISEDLKVSTKTVGRWRDRGLVSRWILANGKRKVGVRQSLLKRFLDQHQEQVAKSSRFTQLNEEEKVAILRRAKRLARVAPGGFTDICRRVGRKFNRSPETVRYTIKKYDQMNIKDPIFPGLHGPLDEQAKQAIYSSHRRGISIDALAERFHRTRTSMYRVINEIRARRILAQPLDLISHASFADQGSDVEIMRPMPNLEGYEASRAKALRSVPKGLPPELSSLYETPLLSREQEAHLFRKMNYLKFKAKELRDTLDPTRARSADLDKIEEYQREALAIKDQLISANMRLVASIAKRHAGAADNYFELLSDGNLSLMRAVEKFDYSRGNKFSTYASWAIMKNFARSIPEEKHRRDRFQTGLEEMFETRADVRTDEQEVVASAERAHNEVNRLLNRLDERERKIIQLRAGLNSERGLTLEQVGKELGITKERVRQLEARTMRKLQSLALEEHVELP